MYVVLNVHYSFVAFYSSTQFPWRVCLTFIYNWEICRILCSHRLLFSFSIPFQWMLFNFTRCAFELKKYFPHFFYLLFRFAEFSPCMMCGVSYYVCFCFECSIWFFFGALVPVIFVRILRQFRLPMNLSAVCGLLCWLGVQYMNVCDPSEIWLMNVLFTCYCCVFEFVLARTHGTQSSTRSQSAVVVRKKYIFFTFDSWKQYVFGMYCARECIF